MLRMLPVRLFALTIMAAAAIVLVAPSAANADGALVINKPDSLGCFFGEPGGVYSGAAVVVTTPSGNVLVQCTHLVLIAGPGVSETTQQEFTFTLPFPPFSTLGCRSVETKSGNANVTCHVDGV